MKRTAHEQPLRSAKRGYVWAFLYVILAASRLLADEAIPLPSETPAEVVVSGRTSTAIDIKIVKVGDKIPKTYSGDKVKNVPDHTWYVSQHFALRSEVSEEESRGYLVVLELAYPHFVWALGDEPPNIETTRLAVSYSKSIDSLKKATQIDLQGVGWLGGGGGVTLNRNGCAYVYPSGGLKYHKRDLVMHEALHAMQMAMVHFECTPVRFVEGITHALANHVYDEARKQLTVAVVDKPTVNNPYDEGLRRLQEKLTTVEDLLDGEGSGPEWMVYTQFCWTDPDRLMKWRLWRGELFRLRLTGPALKETDRRLMAEIFGPFAELNASWEAWVNGRRSTFHYVAWGWEQSADTLWSYGFGKHKFSQTDINYAPSEVVAYDPLRMDYPAEPVPPSVRPLKRGAPEPAVGCVVDFSKTKGKGRAGLGLGVRGAEMLAVLVEKERELVVDGADLGMKRAAFPLPDALRQAAENDRHRYGLTMKIAENELEATVRAGKPSSMQDTVHSVPLSAKVRERLMTSPMAIVAKDGIHGVTPYFDDGRRPPDVDLSQPAPKGRWRFAGDEDLYRLYRVAFRLKDKTPASLLELRDRLAGAMNKELTTQADALDALRADFPKVMKDLLALDRNRDVETALWELSGAAVQLELAEDATWLKPRVELRLRGPSDQAVVGSIEFHAAPPAAFAQPSVPENIRIEKGETATISWEPPRHPGRPQPFRIDASVSLTWREVTIRRTVAERPRFSIPCYWAIGPFRNEGPKGGGIVDIAHQPERDNFDTSRVYATTYRRLPGWKPTEMATIPIGWSRLVAEDNFPLPRAFYVDFMALYGGSPALPVAGNTGAQANNCAAYALVWIESPSDQGATLSMGAEDGIMAWMNGELVHKKLKHRDYRFGSDNASVRLKKGWNKLALKITRGQWGSGWGFSATLVGADGLPLEGLNYSLR
ncbi:MAG: hypothetical protein H8E44_43690 [Planctomycetes bacterium]|nr:hypothetical protein [Planctomycetota bacterium]MBL7042175.1 hypothetical protein [Pirellulaceae bacterium]